jgi:pimeloyl-ACP methyl ester carboxylesterase
MTTAVASAVITRAQSSRRVLRRIAGSLLIVVVLAGAGSYLGVSYVIAERFTHAMRSAIGRAPMVAAPSYENVVFKSTDGVTLRGWFFPVSGDRAAIIVHGKDGNRIGGEHRTNERIAEYLIAHGFSVLLFDLRGSGESDGDRFSLGYLERRDVAAAIDEVAARGFRPDRIALIGISMGAGTVLQTLLLRPDVGAVVADSAYSDARTIVTENLESVAHVPSWFTPGVLVMSNAAFGLNGDAVRPIDVVRAHPERAFLFIHCGGDELIATHHAYELKAASANPSSDLWMAAACQHAWAFPTYPTAYEAHLIAFLDTQIPVSAAR